MRDFRKSLRRADSQIATDLPGQEVIDFSMARHGGGLLVFGVMEDRVAGTLPDELAALFCKVMQKLSSLHALPLNFECYGFSSDVATSAFAC